jgi:hypothetical protein
MEVRIRSLMAAAKFQMDYKTVHNNYLQIRNNTLLNVHNIEFSFLLMNKFQQKIIYINELKIF